MQNPNILEASKQTVTTFCLLRLLAGYSLIAHSSSAGVSMAGSSLYVNEHAGKRKAKLIVNWTITFQSNKLTYRMAEASFVAKLDPEDCSQLRVSSTTTGWQLCTIIGCYKGIVESSFFSGNIILPVRALIKLV